MPQIGGKNAKKKTSSSTTSKRHFTVVIGNKEHGLYVSSSPSSAARKAVSKLCATDKKKKVQFSIREITQGSKKKTYGPYLGEIEKLAKPIELKGRIIKYKPVAKLSGKKTKTGVKKGGMRGGGVYECFDNIPGTNHTFKVEKGKSDGEFTLTAVYSGSNRSNTINTINTSNSYKHKMTLLRSITTNNLIDFLNSNKKNISQSFKSFFFLNNLLVYYFDRGTNAKIIINDNTTETGKSITMQQLLDRITKKLNENLNSAPEGSTASPEFQ
jgi:hypothetical protein